MKKDIRQKLAKLIAENPDMDIIAFTHSDGYDDGLYVKSCVWNVTKQCWNENICNDRIFFKEDFKDIKQYYIDCICEEDNSTDDEKDKKAEEFYNSIEWQENIILWIS